MKNEFFRWLGRSTLLLIGIGSFSLLGSWGLYLQVHKVDQESPEEFRLLLSRWKETGVRGVFLRTFQNHDDRLHSLRPRGSDIGVYFENTLGMPVVYQDSALCGFVRPDSTASGLSSFLVVIASK